MRYNILSATAAVCGGGLFTDKPAEKDVWDGNAKRYAEYYECGLDSIVGCNRNFTYHAVQGEHSKNCSIHKHSWYHRNNTWNAKALMRSL